MSAEWQQFLPSSTSLPNLLRSHPASYSLPPAHRQILLDPYAKLVKGRAVFGQRDALEQFKTKVGAPPTGVCKQRLASFGGLSGLLK